MDENTWLQPPGALASSAYSVQVLEGVSPLLGRLTASQCLGKWELGSPPALPGRTWPILLTHSQGSSGEDHS